MENVLAYRADHIHSVWKSISEGLRENVTTGIISIAGMQDRWKG